MDQLERVASEREAYGSTVFALVGRHAIVATRTGGTNRRERSSASTMAWVGRGDNVILYHDSTLIVESSGYAQEWKFFSPDSAVPNRDTKI